MPWWAELLWLLFGLVLPVAAIAFLFWQERFHPFWGFYDDDYRARHCEWDGKRWRRRARPAARVS